MQASPEIKRQGKCCCTEGFFVLGPKQALSCLDVQFIHPWTPHFKFQEWVSTKHHRNTACLASLFRTVNAVIKPWSPHPRSQVTLPSTTHQVSHVFFSTGLDSGSILLDTQATGMHSSFATKHFKSYTPRISICICMSCRVYNLQHGCSSSFTLCSEFLE